MTKLNDRHRPNLHTHTQLQMAVNLLQVTRYLTECILPWPTMPFAVEAWMMFLSLLFICPFHITGSATHQTCFCVTLTTDISTTNAYNGTWTSEGPQSADKRPECWTVACEPNSSPPLASYPEHESSEGPQSADKRPECWTVACESNSSPPLASYPDYESWMWFETHILAPL
jgi:hypothetical protein